LPQSALSFPKFLHAFLITEPSRSIVSQKLRGSEKWRGSEVKWNQMKWSEQIMAELYFPGRDYPWRHSSLGDQMAGEFCWVDFWSFGSTATITFHWKRKT
jgi:hypothetical protein